MKNAAFMWHSSKIVSGAWYCPLFVEFRYLIKDFSELKSDYDHVYFA